MTENFSYLDVLVHFLANFYEDGVLLYYIFLFSLHAIFSFFILIATFFLTAGVDGRVRQNIISNVVVLLGFFIFFIGFICVEVHSLVYEVEGFSGPQALGLVTTLFFLGLSPAFVLDELLGERYPRVFHARRRFKNHFQSR